MTVTKPLRVLSVRLAVLAAASVGLAACGCSASGGLALPQPGARWDYQLGGDYRPRSGVSVVVRQWADGRALSGGYSICYVNAFQTEADGPDAPSRWPKGVVWKAGGEDPNWPGEYPIHIGTAARRKQAVQHVAGHLSRCATRGFRAVEFDNLDTFTRYPNAPFDRDDAIAYARLLTRAAHARGLAVAQKNTVELLGARSRIGFDFAIVEECGRDRLCRRFADAYDNHVLAVEYSSDGFSAACSSVGRRISVIRRDVDLRTPSRDGYRFRACR